MGPQPHPPPPACGGGPARSASRVTSLYSGPIGWSRDLLAAVAWLVRGRARGGGAPRCLQLLLHAVGSQPAGATGQRERWVSGGRGAPARRATRAAPPAHGPPRPAARCTERRNEVGGMDDVANQRSKWRTRRRAGHWGTLAAEEDRGWRRKCAGVGGGLAHASPPPPSPTPVTHTVASHGDVGGARHGVGSGGLGGAAHDTVSPLPSTGNALGLAAAPGGPRMVGKGRAGVAEGALVVHWPQRCRGEPRGAQRGAHSTARP